MTTPDDPFSGFDWSKQDNGNNSNPSAPPTPPQPPTYVPQPINSAPAPGTFYNNAAGNNQGIQKKRGGTLTAFMVLEWITFAFAILGTCGGIANLATSGSSSSVAQSILATGLNLVILVFSLLSAIRIIQYKKSGITFGWIETGLNWFYMLIQIGFALFSYSDTQSQINESGLFSESTTNGLIIATIVLNLLIGGGWALTKTILLSVKSTKEHVNNYFF